MVTERRHGIPALQAIAQDGDALKLAYWDDKEKAGLALLRLPNNQVAAALGRLLYKCRRHDLRNQNEKFLDVARLMCSVKGKGKGEGNRAELIAQIMAGIIDPNNITGGRNDRPIKRDNRNENT